MVGGRVTRGQTAAEREGPSRGAAWLLAAVSLVLLLISPIAALVIAAFALAVAQALGAGAPRVAALGALAIALVLIVTGSDGAI
jgi:hypothetical protein